MADYEHNWERKYDREAKFAREAEINTRGNAITAIGVKRSGCKRCPIRCEMFFPVAIQWTLRAGN